MSPNGKAEEVQAAAAAWFGVGGLGGAPVWAYPSEHVSRLIPIHEIALWKMCVRSIE